MSKEISFEDLTSKIGIDCVLEVNKQINKVSHLLGLSFNVKIFDDKNDYVIKDEDRIILCVDKFLFFIKPFEWFRLRALKIFDEYELNTNNKFGETIFYDSLTQLQISYKIEIFIYYYLIYVVDYFNLEPEETKLTKTKDDLIIINSAKYEFVYKNNANKEVQYQKIWIVIRVSLKNDELKITKIYPAQKYQNIHLKISDIL